VPPVSAASVIGFEIGEGFDVSVEQSGLMWQEAANPLAAAFDPDVPPFAIEGMPRCSIKVASERWGGMAAHLHLRRKSTFSASSLHRERLARAQGSGTGSTLVAVIVVALAA
jgi:hypothetical protein